VQREASQVHACGCAKFPHAHSCTLYGRAGETMTRGNIYLARGSQCCPKFFFNCFAQPTSLYCEDYIHIYTYLTAYRLFRNYRCWW